jgi:hypothetical protein
MNCLSPKELLRRSIEEQKMIRQKYGFRISRNLIDAAAVIAGEKGD